MTWIADDDCEDQGMAPTDVCTLFECQEWRAGMPWYPPLELRGKFWCCTKCGVSYGERAKERTRKL